MEGTFERRDSGVRLRASGGIAPIARSARPGRPAPLLTAGTLGQPSAGPPGPARLGLSPLTPPAMLHGRERRPLEPLGAEPGQASRLTWARRPIMWARKTTWSTSAEDCLWRAPGRPNDIFAFVRRDCRSRRKEAAGRHRTGSTRHTMRTGPRARAAACPCRHRPRP